MRFNELISKYRKQQYINAVQQNKMLQAKNLKDSSEQYEVLFVYIEN